MGNPDLGEWTFGQDGSVEVEIGDPWPLRYDSTQDLAGDLMGVCVCGSAGEAFDLLVETMRLMGAERGPDHYGAMRDLYHGHEAAKGVALCLLDVAKLIDHGSTIDGSWLTAKGRAVLALADGDVETFARLLPRHPDYAGHADTPKEPR